MQDEPTRSNPAAEEFRAEMVRRGITPDPEVRKWAREQLDAARKAWTPERWEALRARSRRGAAEMFGQQHSNSPAA